MTEKFPHALALASCLASPVARGLLPRDQAEAAIALRVVQQAPPNDDDLGQLIKVYTSLLGQGIEAIEIERARTAQQIIRGIATLLNKAAPQGRVRAEAHNLNADTGTKFREYEIEDLIVDELILRREKSVREANKAKFAAGGYRAKGRFARGR